MTAQGLEERTAKKKGSWEDRRGTAGGFSAHPAPPQPDRLLRKAPFLVLRCLGNGETRVYSKLYGNLTSYDFDINEVLNLFDSPMDAESAIKKLPAIAPREPAGLIKELYEKKFLVGEGTTEDGLLLEYTEKVRHGYEAPGPSKITFLVSAKCNLACRECYHHFYGFRGADMTVDFAVQVLEGLFPHLKARKIPTLVISFLGYEPFLNFETLAAVHARAREMGREYGVNTFFRVYTNAFKLGDRIYRWIGENKSDLGIIVSLDGIKEDNDRMRVDFSGRGTYDRITRNLKKIIATGVESAVITVLTRLNLPNIERFVDEMAALGVKRIFSNIYYGRSGNERKIELTDKEKFEAIKRLDLATARYGMESSGEWKYAVTQMVTGAHFFCPAARKQLVFAADGAIYPCQRFAGTEVNFGAFDGDFWDRLMSGRCGTYNDFASELCGGMEERTKKAEKDLAGCSCPFLPFVRGEGMSEDLEEELNGYLLDYYITRPMDRIITRSPMNY